MKKSKELERHPVPDCIYLALSERVNAVLVTADRRLYERVKDSKYSHFIAWIETPPQQK